MLGTSAYSEPAEPVTYEEKIKRSEFIANVSVCHDEEEARSFLNAIASQHRDATHNCRAYLLSDGREYYSDDGEPSGTAGRPILNAIKRSGLVNVMVVVTRYYGGVKLGVRGLIDAYGGTAEKALSMAGRVERIPTKKFRVALGYESTAAIVKYFTKLAAMNLKWNYGAEVTVSGEVPASESESFSAGLEELKARKIITSWENLS
ncbi:MAG: YigZ family protein [Synergistaceae bacterium]|nr:YigZ family protein [Synergistaceae bacterium]MBQ3654331.1 YigZ family protein [Synergistaceae bacterium]